MEINYNPNFFCINIDNDKDECDLAIKLYLEKNYKDAFTEFTNIISTFQNSVDALNGIGCIYAVNKQYETALTYFNNAIEIADQEYYKILRKCAVNHSAMAITLLNMDNKTEALNHFQKSLSFIKDYNIAIDGANYCSDKSQELPASINIANEISSNQGHLSPKEVLEILKIAIKGQESRANSYVLGFATILTNRANTYFMCKQYDLALNDYHTALNYTNNNLVRALKGKMFIHLINFNYHSALEDVNRILDLDPEHEEANNYFKIIENKLKHGS